MEKCEVLLFGTMADIGERVRENLTGHGISAVLVDFPQNSFRDPWGYGRKLFKSIAEYSPRVIFPIGDPLAMAKLRPQIPQEIIVPISEEATIELLDSKVRTYALADELGIPQPRTYTLEEAVLQTQQLIFKRDRSFGGNGVHRPRNQAALQNLIAHENGAPCLIEDCIEGEDLSIDCIRLGGRFLAESYVCASRIGTLGPSVSRSKTTEPAAEQYARTLLDHLDYRGVCGLDFRRTPEGKLYFLECNPRFTGGLQTQIEEGFHIPYLLYYLCAGL